MRLVNNGLTCSWKWKILEDRENSIILCVYDNHLIKKSRVYAVNKQNSKKLYIIQNVKISQHLLYSYNTN